MVYFSQAIPEREIYEALEGHPDETIRWFRNDAYTPFCPGICRQEFRNRKYPCSDESWIGPTRGR